MTKTRNLIYYTKYRFCAVVFLTVYVVLTFGCTVQSEIDSNVKGDAVQTTPDAVNINTATADDLEKIPYIGEKLARDILEHRETHGRFRKPEHLMLLQGISDKRYREIRGLIRTE